MTTKTKAESRASVLAVWLRPLVDYLERTGYDSALVFSRTGVDAAQVFVPGARLPLSRAAPLWQHAARVTGKPFIGLEIAGDAPPLMADTTAISMMASRHLYEALQRFARLSPVVCDAVQVVLEREGDELRVDFVIDPEERHLMPRESMDPALLIPLGLLDSGMGGLPAVRELRFDCESPGADLEALRAELFPVPTRFDCEHYGLVLDWER